VADHGTGGHWGWRTLGVADPNQSEQWHDWHQSDLKTGVVDPSLITWGSWVLKFKRWRHVAQDWGYHPWNFYLMYTNLSISEKSPLWKVFFLILQYIIGYNNIWCRSPQLHHDPIPKFGGRNPNSPGLTPMHLNTCMSPLGTWWRLGWVDYFQPEGRGFDSRSSRHVGTLGKSFTCSCLCASAWNSDTVSVL